MTSLFCVADELAKRGHDVFVLSDIKHDGKTAAGAIWCARDGSCWLKGENWDFLILNRGIGEGYVGLQAKHRILWTHDLPHNGFIPEPKMMNAFSATVFMSRYAERIWRTFYPAITRSFLIPNGIDRDLFFPRLKDPDYLIYASAPNRGLNRLPLIFDAIKARVAQPVFMRAYSNMEKMHPNEARHSPDFANDYHKIKQESDIELHDPLPQKEFAEQLGIASLMILPTDYPEICSNVIVQSLASGTPVITTGKLGSFGEWIKNGYNGFLTKFHVQDYMTHTLEIVRYAVKFLEDEKLKERMQKNAAKTENIFSWEQIGQKWETMLKKLL